MYLHFIPCMREPSLRVASSWLFHKQLVDFSFNFIFLPSQHTKVCYEILITLCLQQMFYETLPTQMFFYSLSRDCSRGTEKLWNEINVISSSEGWATTKARDRGIYGKKENRFWLGKLSIVRGVKQSGGKLVWKIHALGFDLFGRLKMGSTWVSLSD